MNSKNKKKLKYKVHGTSMKLKCIITTASAFQLHLVILFPSSFLQKLLILNSFKIKSKIEKK